MFLNKADLPGCLPPRQLAAALGVGEHAAAPPSPSAGAASSTAAVFGAPPRSPGATTTDDNGVPPSERGASAAGAEALRRATASGRLRLFQTSLVSGIGLEEATSWFSQAVQQSLV